MTDATEMGPVEGLRARTARGASWTAGGQITRQVIQVLTAIVLARVLSPDDFGVYAMVAAFSGFAAVVADLGFGAAVVQRPELRREHLDTAWWSSVVLGFVLACVLVAAGPLLASFYDDERVAGASGLVAVGLFLGTASSTPRAVLVRSMDFGALVRLEVVAVTMGAATAVAAALAGAGFWAIPLQSVATAAVFAVLVALRGRFRPRLHVDRVALSELFGFGGFQTAFGALNFWSRNADNLLIGRFVGARDLGLYTRAYSLMLTPIVQVATVVGQVMFPALSRVQHDVARSRRGYLTSLRLISLVAMPVLLGAAAAAPSLIDAFLGSEWHDAVPLFRVLALAGVSQVLGTTTGWIFQSQGRTDLLFKWGAFATLVTIVGFAVGIVWGAMGVATAYAVRSYVLAAPNFAIAGRLIGVRPIDVVHQAGPTTLGAMVMAAAVLGVDAATNLRPWPAVFIQVGVGAAVYGAWCALLRPPAVADLRELVADRRS